MRIPDIETCKPFVADFAHFGHSPGLRAPFTHKGLTRRRLLP